MHAYLSMYVHMNVFVYLVFWCTTMMSGKAFLGKANRNFGQTKRKRRTKNKKAHSILYYMRMLFHSYVEIKILLRIS